MVVHRPEGLLPFSVRLDDERLFLFHGGKIVFRFGKCRSGDDPDLVFVIGNEADGNNLLIRLRQGVAGGIEHIFRAPSLDAEGVAAVRHGFALIPVAEVASDNYGQFGFCAGFGRDDDPAGRGTVCARIAERVKHIEIVRFRRRDGDFLFENSVRVAGRRAHDHDGFFIRVEIVDGDAERSPADEIFAEFRFESAPVQHRSLIGPSACSVAGDGVADRPVRIARHRNRCAENIEIQIADFEFSGGLFKADQEMQTPGVRRDVHRTFFPGPLSVRRRDLESGVNVAFSFRGLGAEQNTSGRRQSRIFFDPADFGGELD